MPRKSRVTLGDIARQVGVSPATVSAALSTNHAASAVSDLTRRQVRRIAAQMGYDLGNLRGRRAAADSIAVFCPGSHLPNNAMLYGVLVEVCEILTRQDTRVTLETSNAEEVPDEEFADRLRRTRIDGAIVIGILGYSRQIAAMGVPCVHIGDVPEPAQVCRVHVDNELGGRLVGEHLWTLGHRCVGVVQIAFGTSAEKRVAGIQAVWAEHGASIPPDHILSFDYPFEEELAVALPRLLAKRRGGPGAPTALFCNADWIASGVTRQLRNMGLRVPRDVSVVGFDDAHYASLLDPPLTTVRQPFPEIGALAVQLLHELICSGQLLGKSYVLPCQLVVRGSTAHPGEVIADRL
jgi:LacI family transcriptional regulator